MRLEHPRYLAVAALFLTGLTSSLLLIIHLVPASDLPPTYSPAQQRAGTAAVPISPILHSLSLDERNVAQGKRLFHALRLSRNNSMSCSTCHDLSIGGVDGSRQSVVIGGRRLNFYSPTVFAAGFICRKFWNGRAAILEDQVYSPIQNENELRSSCPEIVAKLILGAAYVAQFEDIHGSIKPEVRQNAIAGFAWPS